MLTELETLEETLPGIGGLEALDTEVDPFPAGRRARALDPERTLPPEGFLDGRRRSDG